MVERGSLYCPAILGNVFHNRIEVWVVFPYACICKPRIGILRSGNQDLDEFTAIETLRGLVAQALHGFIARASLALQCDRVGCAGAIPTLIEPLNQYCHSHRSLSETLKSLVAS